MQAKEVNKLMPKHAVVFLYSIGERVKIVALEGVIGIVESMSVNVLGRDYRVAYWHDGKRLQEWLREDELEEK